MPMYRVAYTDLHTNSHYKKVLFAKDENDLQKVLQSTFNPGNHHIDGYQPAELTGDTRDTKAKEVKKETKK